MPPPSVNVKIQPEKATIPKNKLATNAPRMVIPKILTRTKKRIKRSSNPKSTADIGLIRVDKAIKHYYKHELVKSLYGSMVEYRVGNHS